MMHPGFNLLGMHHAGKIVSPIPLVPLPAGKGGIYSENECEAALWRRFTLIFGSIPPPILGEGQGWGLILA